MSEETSNNPEAEAASESLPAEAQQEATETSAQDAGEHTVPVSALQKEREKAASKIGQLETQLAKIQEADEARKRAELSEVEQARLEADEAKAQTQALQTQLIHEQRKQVALATASTAGFKDPSDALRYVDITGEDLTDDDIREAVSSVLNERGYLKAEAPKGPAQTSGVGDGNQAKKEEGSATASILSDAMKFVGR